MFDDRDLANVEPADDLFDDHDRAMAQRDREDDFSPSEAFARASLSLALPADPPSPASPHPSRATLEGHHIGRQSKTLQDERAAWAAIYGMRQRTGDVSNVVPLRPRFTNAFAYEPHPEDLPAGVLLVDFNKNAAPGLHPDAA
jgi:hypothetical protein